MSELTFLYLFLCVAFVLGPLMTGAFFLNDSKMYSVAHITALFILLVGAVLNLKESALVWPLFCAFGFFLYLRKESKFLISFNGVAESIPFVFSLISSAWFVAGVNDWQLLGYDRTWSFYASLHGAFLGWIFVGCLAFLSRKGKPNKPYLWGCYLCFACFLLIAFGIDGIPYIKRVGVVGVSVIAPALILLYAFNLNRENRASLFFSVLSLCSIAISMTLALLNEFWLSAPRIAFGLPIMVLAHGLMNAAIAVPGFYLAIKFEENSAKVIRRKASR